MDIEQMLQYHYDNKADITVAANCVPVNEASSFGCISANEEGVITGFVEKPLNPPEVKSSPGYSYVSMGNYIFSREILEEAILSDCKDESSSHDFGKDILPNQFGKCRMMAYDFSTNVLPGKDRPYWKDVGSLKTYWEAHMDLLQHPSALTLYNSRWPIRTVSYSDPPGFTYPAKGMSSSVEGCLRAEASQVLGAVVHRCVLSRHCIIHSGSVLDECVIGQGVVIGENCKLRRVIVDSHNVIPPNTVIGYDSENDAEKYHRDEESGLVVVEMPRIQLRKDKNSGSESRFNEEMFASF
jgi:glucose-1-phosphate adenylyltransferase